MHEIKTPPFFASKSVCTSIDVAASYCLTGVMTDEYSRVIKPDGLVVPGLWAVGDLQGGRWNSGDSNVVSCMQNNLAQTSGRLAGQMAAKM